MAFSQRAHARTLVNDEEHEISTSAGLQGKRHVEVGDVGFNTSGLEVMAQICLESSTLWTAHRQAGFCRAPVSVPRSGRGQLHMQATRPGLSES